MLQKAYSKSRTNYIPLAWIIALVYNWDTLHLSRLQCGSLCRDYCKVGHPCNVTASFDK